MRVVAFLSSAAALVLFAAGFVPQEQSNYLLVAGGLLYVVVAQELVPTDRFDAWRIALETAALIVYIAALITASGGIASPLAVAYLLLVATTAAWGGALAVLLVTLASCLTYGVALLLEVPPGPESVSRLVIQAAALTGAVVVTGLAAVVVARRRQPAVPAPTPTIGLGRLEPPALNTLDFAVRGLLLRTPEMSAFHTLSRGQVGVAAVGLALLVAGLLVGALQTILVVNAVLTAVYLIALGFNLAIFRDLLRRPPMLMVSDAEARAVADGDLPTYTVLVAAYREGEIIAETIRQVERLEYPRDRLDVLLLLEADDRATIEAAVAARPAENIRVIVVPDAQPKTKPKACNYGLQLSSGQLVTIFDAEDRPDPLQLRRAAVAFSRLPAKVACVQSRLQFHNEDQNLLTRWFAAEYLTWFASVLPAIVRLRAPVPLGGTSMHIRREVLDTVGAWDPFNVTEDADLGVRLYRYGYQTHVLDSVTLEEANSDFINWVKQRSRWYKGYLQTWLVHMREPRRLWRELGAAGVLGFSVLVGTTPLLALLNPFFWVLTAIWFLTESPAVQALFPPLIFYPALVSVVFGNFLALYRTLVAVRLAGRPSLALSVLLLPIYWVFMSIAALRAFVQLLIAPSVWEKTLHGLDRMAETAPLNPSH